ncbi:hypothetical protein GCM10010230_36990 [Streptomyces narbonensis]|nr:hypothetical protein GCM10010230_36990 [Streptomyces narbonensis]
MRPGEADADPDEPAVLVPVPGTGEDGVVGVVGEPEGVTVEGVVPVAVGAEGPAGVGGVGPVGVDGATARGPAEPSAVYPRGAAPKVTAPANVQANVQVSAGPRARARALRSAGVTG